MTNWMDDLVSPHIKNRIAWSGELEFCGASEDDRTGRTVQFRLVRRPEDMLAAHPFSTYTRRRRGHAGTRFEAVFSLVNPLIDKTISCEVMLLHWADGPGGATVKFLLDHEAKEHPFFAGCCRRTKEAAGSTYQTVLLEMDDDNTIVDQAQRERVEERHQQKLSNVAAMLVKNPRFHAWLDEMAPPLGSEWNAKNADLWLKDTLHIESKTELDVPGSPRIAPFLKLKAAFVDWQEDNGYSLER